MYALSGFIKIAAMVSNEPSVDSVLGELSQRSATFTRELGHYSNTTYPDVKLAAFNSNRDDVLVEVDPSYSNISLQISQWLFQRSIDGSLSDDRESCRQQILSQFGAAVELIRVGNMVSNGNYWLPEQIVFSVLGGGEPNVIRLWYSDPSFQAQYDLFEILVVPIVTPLDDLHGPRANVLQILSGLTVPVVLNKIDDLVGRFPPTEIISNEYDWTDKNDPSITKATPWTVVVYGAAGNNADLIREALVNWILENSNQPRSEWEKIYPDLFLPNEFYITPIWDRYSIPNQLTVGGLYSPTLKYRDMMSYGVSTFFQIPLLHIRDHMTHSVSIYKSLSFVAVGNPRNRNGVYSFDVLWPQYATIGSDRLDFNRLPPKTAEFILLLTQMFLVAESLTEFGNIPPGMSRVTRGGMQYLAMTYDKMLYLVSLKANPIFNVDPEDPTPPPVDEPDYYIQVNVGIGMSSGVVANVYERVIVDGVEESIPIDSSIVVHWEAVWYDNQEDVLRSVVIEDGSYEQLPFSEQYDGSGGRIEITATFNDRTVTVDHILDQF